MTYEEYCGNIDYVFSMDEGMFDSFKEVVSNVKLSIVTTFREEFSEIKEKVGLSWQHIITALKNKDVFHLLKAVGFGFAQLLKGLNALTKMLSQGLRSIFVEIAKNKYVQKIQSGAMKVDELLDKYPLLKKIGGPIMAGLLFYLWMSMTFIGHMDYDFDLSHIAAALKGNYSIESLFASPEGIMMLALVGTGSLISMPWLGQSMFNILLGVLYTGVKKAKDHDAISKIKGHLELKPL
jgi:hypothetical protein